jgi:hypothetical protein
MCIICDTNRTGVKGIMKNNPTMGYDEAMHRWAIANPAAHFQIGQKCTCAAERTEAELEKQQKTLERKKFLAEHRDLLEENKVLRSGNMY